MKLPLYQAVRAAGSDLGDGSVNGRLFASRVDDIRTVKVPADGGGVMFDLFRLTNQDRYREPGHQRVARGLQNRTADGADKRHRPRRGTACQRQEFRREGRVGRRQERACHR